VHNVGRIVRWDEVTGSGAVVVEGLAAEIAVDLSVVDVPGDRGLQPGELVEVVFEATGAGYTAARVCPADGEA
jgi:archaellum component FlaG (FlaF/FlaG flagellin family)